MNLPEVKIEDLLEAGVHFGHNVRRWNPKMEDYIFGVRNNIHIFDLRITLEALNSSLVKIHETVAKSGKILFVGTKKQCAESVKELASPSEERVELHRIIYEELCLGVVKESSQEYYLGVIEKLQTAGAEGIILGCTEIGMLVSKKDTTVRLYDTTKIHAERAVNFALEF